MTDTVGNLNRGIDHLEVVATLCGTIQQRIANEMDMSPEWLSSMAGLIKGNAQAANKICADEAAVANGFSREFIAQIDEGIIACVDSQGKMAIQKVEGDVVHIGRDRAQPFNTIKGDDCA